MIEQKNKNLIFLMILLFGILILNSFLGGRIVSAATQTYCAETTVSLPNVGVLHCLDGLDISEVNQNDRYSPSSCDSTEYCGKGTCVDTISGKCLSARKATCNSADGGTWYNSIPSNTLACQVGCCLLGDQASFTTDAGCGVLAAYAGVTKNFDATVTNENTCISMARPQAKGACVYEASNGRTCDFTTRQLCQNLGTAKGTFYEGFLCANPTLGTNCVRTKQTTCLDNSNQIFFVDSCGNSANVYDSSKAEDVNYWSYLAGSDVGIANGVIVSIGDGAGNIGSATSGNCNYYLGSTCMQYDRSVDPSAPGLMGNNICRNVNCVSGTFASLFNGVYGRTPYNGETWCGEATADSVTLTSGNPGINSSNFSQISNYNKSGNLPGSTEVLFTCANGRITTEVNAAYRSKICVQTTGTNGYIGAGFQVNLWQDCYYQNSSANCLNTEERECKWITGASILKDESGTPLVWDETQDLLVPRVDTKNILGGKDFDTRQEASCVPKYSPGFDPSVTQTDFSPQTICGFASRVCYVNYSKGGIASYVVNYVGDLFPATTITCLNHDETLNASWGQNMINLCASLGDCGISVNYINSDGSNKQKDLFSIIKGNTSGILK